jgi:poly(A) polymerase
MKPEPHSPADGALEIVKTLRAKGHVALLAGGCVRDMLLGREPKDYDVATDAHPEQVQRLFPKARLVGVKFGVVLVRKFGHDVEVATFRTDSAYSDGRHPDSVTFGEELEDARRRDFTINGLFFDPIEDRVIDHVDGRKDLEARLIRTIGDPERRFAEDYLRMLRAVRFAVQLESFSIEPATGAAIRRLAERLPAISPERIWMELEGILTSPWPAEGWAYLVDLGLSSYIVPGWQASPEESARIKRRLAGLGGAPPTPGLALAIMFQERPFTRVEPLCRDLRLSNRLTETIVWLVGALPKLLDAADLELADLKILMAGPAWDDLCRLSTSTITKADPRSSALLRTLDRAKAIPIEDAAPPPLLTGDELGAMGMKPGPRFGDILKAVYRAQLNESITTKAQAQDLAGRLMRGVKPPLGDSPLPLYPPA